MKESENKESRAVILNHLLATLDKASEDLNIPALSDEQVKEKLARMLLEDVESEIHTKLSDAVVDAIKELTKEVKGVKEEVKDLGEDHKIMNDDIGSVIKGQTGIMRVVGAEHDKTREEVKNALKKAADKVVKTAQDIDYYSKNY